MKESQEKEFRVQCLERVLITAHGTSVTTDLQGKTWILLHPVSTSSKCASVNSIEDTLKEGLWYANSGNSQITMMVGVSLHGRDIFRSTEDVHEPRRKKSHRWGL